MATTADRRTPRRVLIVGSSARAAAEAAARAGWPVTTVEAFGDCDQHPAVRSLVLSGRFRPAAAVRVAGSQPADATVYLAPFENHPRDVARLGARLPVWGNTPEVLARVRDPQVVARALTDRNLGAPAVAVGRDARPRAARAGHRWLVKPLASGGGQRIRDWRPGHVLPARSYLQERVDGVPGSAVFVAARGKAVLLGVTRQLVGDRAFGAGGYRYCGSILRAGTPAGEASQWVQRVTALVEALADEFGLVGLGGVDFVERDGVPWLVEVNPRWTASMELVDMDAAGATFRRHVVACTAGRLPDAQGLGTGARSIVGKAVLFARRGVTVGDTSRWRDGGIRDVPRPGTAIAAGRPVCTILAPGRDPEDCYRRLVRRATDVYTELAGWCPAGDDDTVRQRVAVE